MSSEASPKVLSHLDPYMRHRPVSRFCKISERCYREFHKLLSGRVREKETPREHLATRLIYFAETTSTAVRLTVTWALSLPGMSLVRDRYEQTVRFSWLARQTDHSELVKYIASYYAKANKIFRNLSPEAESQLQADGVKFADWMKTTPTKEQRDYLNRWASLDLKSMAQKRDALPPPVDTPLAKEKLADLYSAVYEQFSSVTHYDMYGANLLGLHTSPDGQLVLAPHPQWPAVLCAYNSLFDLIQCHDAIIGFYKIGGTSSFDPLFAEWHSLFAVAQQQASP